MVLITSDNYQLIKAKIKQALQTCGDTQGATREDDARLNELDGIISDIDLLLHPATDER